MIREKARFFWQNLPIYKDTEMPSFSNGWLHGFQARKGIKDRTFFFGEEGSVPGDSEARMVSIRMTLNAYNPRDIFNCDETSLFWKQIPDRSLATRSLPGRKKEKARITALFCCNSDGSEKLPTWYIGTAKTPRAFKPLESISKI